MKMMDKREFICILIIVILFIAITATAALEYGYILGTKGLADCDRKVSKMETSVSELSGRVVAHDAIIKNLHQMRK
jgi:hypothetical protein